MKHIILIAITFCVNSLFSQEVGTRENMISKGKISKSEKNKPVNEEFESLNDKKVILDQLVSDYWSVQKDIKAAKRNNLPNLKEELEVKSTKIQYLYIVEFESLIEIPKNPEYTKVYNQFKKDQIAQ